MNKTDIKKLSVLGMLTGAAFLCTALIKIPVSFLSLEPKDTVIAMAGFLYGPAGAIEVAALTAFIEMCTISQTGIIGFAMNVLSSGFFACSAALVYKRKKTFRMAVNGLALGTCVMSAVMLLWNYLITPLYMNVPRAQVAGLLLTLFLPFNLLKGVMNSALTVLLYKPLSRSLRSYGLLPETEAQGKAVSRRTAVFIAVGVFVLAVTGVLLLRRSL